MKKLRNFYFIAGLCSLAFALLTKHIPGITVTDFVNGFCYGVSVTMFIAGLITSAIPLFCHKKKVSPAALNTNVSAAGHDAATKTPDATQQDTSVNTR